MVMHGAFRPNLHALIHATGGPRTKIL